MIPLHQVVPGALEAVLRKAPLTPEKVAFAWRLAAGPAIARVTVVHLRDGVLQVRARDETWQREVERAAALIRARLAPILGEGTVRSLAVVIG